MNWNEIKKLYNPPKDILWQYVSTYWYLLHLGVIVIIVISFIK